MTWGCMSVSAHPLHQTKCSKKIQAYNLENVTCGWSILSMKTPRVLALVVYSYNPTTERSKAVGLQHSLGCMIRTCLRNGWYVWLLLIFAVLSSEHPWTSESHLAQHHVLNSTEEHLWTFVSGLPPSLFFGIHYVDLHTVITDVSHQNCHLVVLSRGAASQHATTFQQLT